MVEIAIRNSSGDLIAESVSALPLPRDDNDNSDRWNLRSATAAWLRSRKSPHTRTAYFRDLATWLTWCTQTDLDPRLARRGDVDMWATTITGSPATIARRLAAVSSWYKYLITNEVLIGNPVESVDRPTVDQDTSTTVGLTGTEAGAFMRTARTTCSPRDVALLGMLAELGLRVSEALGLDVEDFRMNRGHRTVMVTGKGLRSRELPIPPPLARSLDAYLEGREDLTGPVFRTRSGRRLDEPSVFKLVRRVARAAGLAEADRLSPHGLRHTVATAAFDAGAELRDVQDLMGHADPRTTRRYDRARGSLDRSPAYRIAGLFADPTD